MTFSIHFLIFMALHDSERIALEVLSRILVKLLILKFLILASFLLLRLTHLILGHLVFLWERLAVLSRLSRIIHFISLVAVTQPIVKIIPELFQNVHISTLAISKPLTVLLHPSSLSCQFGIVLYAIQVPALNILALGTLSILIVLAGYVWLVLHSIVIVSTLVSVFLTTTARSITCRHVNFYQIIQGILRMMFFTMFEMHESCTAIHV